MLLQLASVKFESAAVTGAKDKPITTHATPQSILV